MPIRARNSLPPVAGSVPSTRTAPDVGARNPSSISIVVVLPGAVGAEHGHDLAGVDGERHAAHRVDVAVGLVEVLDLDRARSRRRPYRVAPSGVPDVIGRRRSSAAARSRRPRRGRAWSCRGTRRRTPPRSAGGSCFRLSVSTLASFHNRAPRAIHGSDACAARTPRTLFAAMAVPVPVQHISTPRSASPPATSSPTARAIDGHDEVGADRDELGRARRAGHAPRRRTRCRRRRRTRSAGSAARSCVGEDRAACRVGLERRAVDRAGDAAGRALGRAHVGASPTKHTTPATAASTAAIVSAVCTASVTATAPVASARPAAAGITASAVRLAARAIALLTPDATLTWR